MNEAGIVYSKDEVNIYPNKLSQEKFDEVVSKIKEASELSKKTNIPIVVAAQRQVFKNKYVSSESNAGYSLMSDSIAKALDNQVLYEMKLAAEKYNKEHSIKEDKSEKITIKKVLIATGILVFTIITVGFIEGLKNERHISND